MLLTNFRMMARYNVLTPIALIAAICCGTSALAAEQVIPAGAVDTNGVELAAGDSLTNSGDISNAGPAVLYPGPDTGTITFVLNTTTGTISAVGDIAVGINGNLTEFENNGTITTDTFAGLGVAGDLGSFINTGSMSNSSDTAVAVDGHVGSFTNSGLLSGARHQAAYFGRGVTSFVNQADGVIENTAALDGSGDGLGFNTDLNTGGVVDSFVNEGVIRGDLTAPESAGVAFFDDSNNDPNASQVGSFVNSGSIEGAGNGVYGKGGFVSFTNSGQITGHQYEAVGSKGAVGTFVNSGTITNTAESAVGINGAVGSFSNSGTISGARYDAVFFQQGIDTFVNQATGVIGNTAALDGAGNGVGFNTDLTDGGAVGSFENYGSITADMAGVDGNAVGFYDNSNNDPNAFQTGSFFNAGSLTGLGNGVFSRGGFGSFTNAAAGVISGQQYAGVETNGPIGTFSNAGTISSVNDQGMRIRGAVGSFVNSGRITSEHNRGVRFDSLVGDFSNSGTIQSEGNGVTFTGGFGTASNSGTIAATAASGQFGVRIDQAGGTFTNSGTIEGSIAAIGYNLGASGANTVINSGTLRGTDGMALAFDGGADGDDMLKLLTGSVVDGDIAFGGGTDTLDFSGFTGNALLRAYDVEDLVAGDNLYTYDQPSDEIAIIDKTGIVAPGAVAARDISLQLQNMLAAQLSSLGSSAPADDLALNYGPAAVQSDAAVAIDDNADLAPGRSVWGSLIGGGSHDDAPVELSNVFGGIVAGGHARVSGGTTIGVLGGYVAGQLDSNNGGQTVGSNTGVVGVYGRSELGNVDVDYALLGGFTGHHSERQMISLGVPETAVADYSSWFLSPSLGIAVPVLTQANGELRVTSRVSYVGGDVAGYSESGSSVNLTVGNQAIGLLDARFGFDGTVWGAPTAAGTVRFTANAGLYVQSNLGGSSTPVSFLGQTQNVAAAGTTTYGIYGGAGIAANIAANTSVNVNLDGQFGNDGQASGAIKAGLVGNF